LDEGVTAARAEVDCGPSRQGATLNDGCDEERNSYCLLFILPNPPGWDGKEAMEKALRRYKACVNNRHPISVRPSSPER